MSTPPREITGGWNQALPIDHGSAQSLTINCQAMTRPAKTGSSRRTRAVALSQHSF